jgi:hypothetical protein
MKLHEQVTGIATREDLVGFVEALRADLLSNPQDWENATLDQYFRALASWLEDCSGYYERTGQDVPTTPSWKNVAEMLIARTTLVVDARKQLFATRSASRLPPARPSHRTYGANVIEAGHSMIFGRSWSTSHEQC